MGLQVTDVQKALKGASYPAGRDELVEQAQRNGAPENVIEALRGSGQRSYEDPTDVMKALSGSLGGD